MNPSAYTIMTPFGQIEATFPEDGGCELDGPAGAVDHFEHVIAQCTNGMGIGISRHNLEPDSLVHFCQPEGSMVTVIPPLDAA